MVRATSDRIAAIQNGSGVLLARLVDRAGVGVRPSEVRTIEYSLYELDPWWPHLFSSVTGRTAVALAVEDVLFDSLQVDEVWTVDSLGYNFRHEIRFGERMQFSQGRFHYEVCYQITLTSKQITVVRFQLRC
jgi:hypothetical protein